MRAMRDLTDTEYWALVWASQAVRWVAIEHEHQPIITRSDVDAYLADNFDMSPEAARMINNASDSLNLFRFNGSWHTDLGGAEPTSRSDIQRTVQNWAVTPRWCGTGQRARVSGFNFAG